MTRFQALAVAVVFLLANPLLGQFVYVTGSNRVSGYTLNATTGALTAIPGSPFPAGLGASSVAVEPTGKFAYVVNEISGNISEYTINATTGALTTIPGSPFPAGGRPYLFEVDPTGRFIYAANFYSDTISAYTINATTGVLTAIPGSPFAAGDGPFSVAVDPTGRFIYVTNRECCNNGSVSAYTINATTGALTPIPGSPFPTGINPDYVAVDSTGKFVYVTNPSFDNVSGYAINATTGALTPIPGSPFPTGRTPTALAVDPTGKFVYVLNNENYGSVSAYTINATTGALTPIAGSPFAAGSGFEIDIAVDPTGKFVYVTDSGFIHQIFGYTIDPTTGVLTAIPGSPFPVLDGPQFMAITGCSSRPRSEVSPLPAAEFSVSFSVRWSDLHSCGAPAIQNYTIYVSDNGGPFTPWLTQTTATEATFSGVTGHTYGFYSIAQDAAGNVEFPKSVADTITYVDTVKPVSHVSPLPANTTSPNFQVQWSGTDAGGPGIGKYNVYVSDNGSSFALWQSNTSATQAWFAGYLGHAYAFFSQATDVYGHQEDLRSAADATTRTPTRLPEDVNADGQINCLDIARVKAAMGSTPGRPNWNPAADVNGDGVVNVRDLALVSQKLMAGTFCN